MTLANFSNNLVPSFPSFLDKFFDRDLMDWNNFNFSGEQMTLPAVNVKENDNEFRVEVAAPGLKKEDFHLNFDNGALTISSEKQEEKEEKEGEKVTRKEFSYQSFQRTIRVPESIVEVDKIAAKYADGILHITMPKRDEVKPKPPKQIKIS
jgi:HSP20 family protein